MVEHHTLGYLRRALGAIPSSSASSSELTPPESSDNSSELSVQTSAGASDSEDHQFVIVKKTTLPTVAKLDATPAPKTRDQVPLIDESSPFPNGRMMLLKDGALKSRQSPFFLIADGTGSIGSYIHLPSHIKSSMRINGEKKSNYNFNY